MAFNCDADTWEAKFRNGVGSVPVGGNNPQIGGSIVRQPVIQHKKRSLTQYRDLTGKLQIKNPTLKK